MSQQQDLDWDHSAGEQLTDQNYSSLDDNGEDEQYCSGIAPFYDHTSGSNREQYATLSKRQLSFLIRTLDDAQSLLKAKASIQRLSTPQHQQRSTPVPVVSGTETACTECSASRCVGLIIKYNLLVTIIIQAVMLICVTILDITESSSEHASNETKLSNTSLLNSKKQHPHQLTSYAVMSTLIALNLLMVVYISVKTVRNLVRSLATTWMLAQAYLSTLLVFASLYTITYRIDVHSWTLHGFNKERDEDIETIVAYLYLKMLFHSISTSTLCGASTIHPDAWYNFIVMAFQMLLSFVYFTSILSQVIGGGGTTLISPGKAPPADPPNMLRRNNSCQSVISRESINPIQENGTAAGERQCLINNLSADFSRYNAI